MITYLLFQQSSGTVLKSSSRTQELCKSLPAELRGCVKVEVVVLGSPSQTARNSGLRGRKATLRGLFQLCGTVTESRQPAAVET